MPRRSPSGACGRSGGARAWRERPRPAHFTPLAVFGGANRVLSQTAVANSARGCSLDGNPQVTRPEGRKPEREAAATLLLHLRSRFLFNICTGQSGDCTVEGACAGNCHKKLAPAEDGAATTAACMHMALCSRRRAASLCVRVCVCVCTFRIMICSAPQLPDSLPGTEQEQRRTDDNSLAEILLRMEQPSPCSLVLCNHGKMSSVWAIPLFLLLRSSPNVESLDAFSTYVQFAVPVDDFRRKFLLARGHQQWLSGAARV